MKRIISIICIAISTLVLLVFAILPHHHHGEETCIVMEYCEQDDAINDEHTCHNNETNEQHGGSCAVELKFTVPHFNDEAKCKISSCKEYNHNHIYFSPVYFLVADFFRVDIGDSATGTDCVERISFYESADAGQSHGLRAPPFLS